MFWIWNGYGYDNISIISEERQEAKMMAEFCKKHIKTIMGLEPSHKLYTEWLTEDGICEECGYDYLKDVDLQETKKAD